MKSLETHINEALSTNKANDKYLFGDCRQFAIAFQQIYGGEIIEFIIDSTVYHVYVDINGKHVDVKGFRSLVDMSLSMFGSVKSFTTSKVINIDEFVNKYSSSAKHKKSIDNAKEYISTNKYLFKH